MQKRTNFQIRSDAAKQRWVRDDRKEAFWRKHILAWKSSGLSKRAYCIQHNLSQSSFNAWNREIGIRDREKIPSLNAAELTAGRPGGASVPFVPLRLLPEETEDLPPPGNGSQSAPQIFASQPLGPRVEIVVPGGAVIRVDENCSAKYVVELFSSLKGLL